jgi:LPS-assembly lipoprotein
MIRASIAAAAVLVLAALSGCTVQPLLATQEGVAGQQAAVANLSSIAVNPVSTRHAQQVRNHLIFLLHGGAAQPASPAYRLELGVTSTVASAAQVQVTTRDTEPTAGTVTLNGTYRLIDTATGLAAAQGRRQVTSAFDRPLQEFAVLRAERDAEDRSARELAELLRLAVSQDMARLGLR